MGAFPSMDARTQGSLWLAGWAGPLYGPLDGPLDGPLECCTWEIVRLIGEAQIKAALGQAFFFSAVDPVDFPISHRI